MLISLLPDEAHLSSWAGICLDNNESARRKKKSGKNAESKFSFERGVIESAWSVSKPKTNIIVPSVITS